MKCSRETNSIKFASYLHMYYYISGADGLSGFKRRKKVWHPPMRWGDSSLFASTATLIGLRAHFPDGTSEILYENEFVNSPSGSIPVNYSFEVENYFNSMTQFAKLEKQATEMPPYVLPDSEIAIDLVGIPCLADR